MRPPNQFNRRQFIQNSANATLAAGSLSFFSQLPTVSAAEAQLNPNQLQYTNGIEPLVRLIEETPRGKLLEEIATKIKAGTSYQEVLAGLLYAGVRNVQPRPSVGFKFHAVLVVNSCHLASLHGPDEDRWLPIFWALDEFKSSQADEKNRSGWRMHAVDEARVPPPEKARETFIEAMETWDEAKADVATAAIVRHLPANEVFNLFARFAARDYRSIGHKVIFLANSWRTLQVIGWNNAEPVLRSLAFALLNHEGEGNPAENNYAADLPWRENDKRIGQLSPGWKSGELNSNATKDLIQTFRSDTAIDAGQAAMEAVAKGVDPQSLWDAVFVGAGELLMRQPGIIGLHGLTTANAIHYVYQQVGSDKLRRQLLLQASSFSPMFKGSAEGRGGLKPTTFDKWSEESVTQAENVDEIVAAISKNKMQASLQVREYLRRGGNPYELIDEARRQVFLRGRNAHDYKYSSAVLEDFTAVSPEWRNDFLSLSVFNLKGSQDQPSKLVERTRSALS